MNDRLKVDGISINTRRRVEQLVEEAQREGHSTIDLSEVEFMSRSVADEFVHHKIESDIQLCGLQEPIRDLIDAVEASKKVVPN